MNIIPVIDLLGGQIVRAVQGRRAEYRPISSRLCDDPSPLDVARRLLDYTGSHILYVADLDALTGGQVQTAQIAALLEALPGTEIWLDAGFADSDAFTALCAALGTPASRLTPVFGSESLPSPNAASVALADRTRAVLSLDRVPDSTDDRGACWTTPSIWPQRVIVMTLERVGAFAGPDLETLQRLSALAPHCQLIGAGGIRDAQDIASTARAGATAWLVASALHDLRIPPSACSSFEPN